MKKNQVFLLLLILIPTIGKTAQVTVTPSLSAKTEYTSNVNRVSDNQDPQDDFVTTISPAVSLSALGKNKGMTITYSPSRVFYNELTEFKYWRHRLSLSAYSNLTKNTNFSIGGSYLQSEDPADSERRTYVGASADSENQTDIEDPTGFENRADIYDVDFTDRRGREKYSTYAANARLSQQIGKRSNISLGVNYGGTENDDPSLEDSHYYGASLGISHGFATRWSTSLNLGYRRGVFEVTDDFDNYFGSISLACQVNKRLSTYLTYQLTSYLSELASNENNDDERVHDISGGFDYQLDRDLNLGAQVGYFLRRLPDRDDESDAYGNVNLTKTYRRGSIGASIGSGYDYSYFKAENLGYNYYYMATIDGRYDFAERITGNAYAGYRRGEYEGNQTRDTYSAGCGMTYQLLEWLSMGAGYSIRYHKPEETSGEYTDQRIYVSLSASKEYLIYK